MSKIHAALNEIDKFESLAKRDQWVNQIHPLVKLLLSIFYIAITVSFNKYNLSGLFVMAIYPFFVFQMGDLSFKDALHRMRIILPIVCVVGIFNPIFDRQPAMELGGFVVTAGMISMLSLMIKGILTVLAAYLLIATTSIEDICYALGRLRLPRILVIIILLIYRYISLFLVEAERITTAYKLRAPGQKGINYKAWGPLVGQMLLRSMDRASAVYDSMCLRGFRGEFYANRKQKMSGKDLLYFFLWLAVFCILRYTRVISQLGGLFVS